MRIAQARQLFDDDVVAGHRYGAASKRPNFRQHLERPSESGDLRENLLGSADHLPVLDVVCGLVPRADQSPVLDRSARQVCAQMSTPPRDREVVAVDVSWEQDAERPTLEGLEEIRLAVGYRSAADAREIEAPVLSLRDGKDNVIWAIELDEPAAGAKITWKPIDPTLPSIDLGDLGDESGESGDQ